MKKLKMILPMLAFVLAIGVSFAFVKADDNLSTGYVYDSGSWIPVDVNCVGSEFTCRVQFVDENENPLSNILEVYPIPAFKYENDDPVFPMKSSSTNVILIK